MQGTDDKKNGLQNKSADAGVKHRPSRSVSIFLALAAIVILSPMAGALLWRDEPLSYYLEFPPRLGGAAHAPFSWNVFIGLAMLIAACLFPFVRQAVRAAGTPGGQKKQARRRFPWWGYAGAVLCGGAWVFAWTRFPWFSGFQPYAFPFLWIGYILVVNALLYKRTGSCRLFAEPGYFLALFPASAVFWWFFEYLNRFVLNWYYVQIDMFGPWQYIFYASACFSTVLPAVLSTADLLASFPFIKRAFRDFLPIRPAHPAAIAAALLLLSASAMFCLGLFPDILFPFIWVAPLLSLVSLQVLAGREHIFSPVSKGDWSRLAALVTAGLVCGFFWEMWNYYSLARWEYSIPWVHRFQVFEMPLLGYAGYLPFALECAAAGDLLKSMVRPGRMPEA